MNYRCKCSKECFIVSLINSFYRLSFAKKCFKFVLDAATGFVVLPLILSDDPGMSFENLHGDSEKARQFKKRVYANRQLNGFFKSLLAKFDLKGLLNNKKIDIVT